MLLFTSSAATEEVKEPHVQGLRAGSGHAGAGLAASCTQLVQKFAPVLQRGHMCDEADDVCKLCVTVTPGSRGFGIAPLLINLTQSGEGHARSRRVARRLAAPKGGAGGS